MSADKGLSFSLSDVALYIFCGILIGIGLTKIFYGVG